MGILRRRLSSAREGIDSLPWIETTGEYAIQLYDRKNCIAKMWNLETGEEYTKGMYGWNPPNLGYPYKIGIEWTPDVTDVSDIFARAQIRTVSAGLLSPIADTLVNVLGMFSYCHLVSIPDNMFKGCNNITNFQNCFNQCQGLTGPTTTIDGLELWEYFPDANGLGCYAYCTGLSNYNEIPSAWK